MTVDVAHVLATGGMDRHLAYVALSRHRSGVHLHWSAAEFGTREALADRLGRERAKDSSLDYDEGEAVAAYAGRRGLAPLEPPAGAVARGERPAAAAGDFQQEERLREIRSWLARDPGAARRNLENRRIEQALRPILPALAQAIERQAAAVAALVDAAVRFGEKMQAFAVAAALVLPATRGADAPAQIPSAEPEADKPETPALRAAVAALRDPPAAPPMETGKDLALRAMDSYARALMDAKRIRDMGLPIPEFQLNALDDAGDALNAAQRGSVDALLSAAAQDPVIRRAMTELEGPERAAQLLAGIDRARQKRDEAEAAAREKREAEASEMEAAKAAAWRREWQAEAARKELVEQTRVKRLEAEALSLEIKLTAALHNPERRDSLGRGVTPAEVAAAVDSDRKVQHRRWLLSDKLKFVYRDPDAAFAKLVALEKANGGIAGAQHAWEQKGAEILGRLNGSAGWLSGLAERELRKLAGEKGFEILATRVSLLDAEKSAASDYRLSVDDQIRRDQRPARPEPHLNTGDPIDIILSQIQAAIRPQQTAPEQPPPAQQQADMNQRRADFEGRRMQPRRDAEREERKRRQEPLDPNVKAERLVARWKEIEQERDKLNPWRRYFEHKEAYEKSDALRNDLIGEIGKDDEMDCVLWAHRQEFGFGERSPLGEALRESPAVRALEGDLEDQPRPSPSPGP